MPAPHLPPLWSAAVTLARVRGTLQRGPAATPLRFAEKETELFPVANVPLSENLKKRTLALVKNNLGHYLFKVASGVNKTAVGD